MPSIWLRVKVKVPRSMTGWCIWSQGVWLSRYLSDLISPPSTYFPTSLTLSAPAIITPHCTLNSPDILLQSYCTCFSLLEIFFPQTYSQVTALSLPSNLYWKVIWILYFKFNIPATDIRNPSSFFFFSTIMQLTTYYFLIVCLFQ